MHKPLLSPDDGLTEAQQSELIALANSLMRLSPHHNKSYWRGGPRDYCFILIILIVLPFVAFAVAGLMIILSPVAVFAFLLNIFLAAERSDSGAWIASAPGSRSMKVLKFLFSKKAFENVFAQSIVDMRDEHAEALVDEQVWKARWIVVRGHVGLWLAVVTYLASTVVKKVVDVWKLIP